MKHHPHISSLVDLYQAELQPFRKVHRMIDLFETIIKSHTVVIMGEYFAYNRLSDSAKGLLAQGLRTPSLGTWQLFSRVLFEELQKEGYTWSFPEFPVEFTELDKALNADKTNVISFRNGYAHGATPSDAQCETDIKKFEPFLQKLLNSQWLNLTRLEHTENKVWIVSDEKRVCLHPILLYKEDGDSSPYAFFNDLKNDKVGLLNYPLSKHYREKELYKEFHEYLPLNEWKKTGNNEFYQRIEELTETFKGRIMEREKLLQFVLNHQKGYFSIQGNPGIGKSALIAQFFKDLKAHKEANDILVVEYFIRRGTAQAQVDYLFNYLIKKTDELFPAGKEIRAEGKAIWDLQQQLFSKWRLWGERSNGKKLLFLIDGLDEGVENNVVTYLPRENFEQVLIIYGSRPGGHKTIDDLWTQLPVEYHTKLELSGLSVEDIRALIYEVANKYEIDRESSWIDAVQKRSQGNPLYLKLLCDAIEHGSIALNDIKALPKEIDEYYKAILDRYANDVVDGDALLKGLYAFAAAKDYLTMSHLGLINQLGEASVQRIGSTLKEVLYENPLTEDVLDYQLFHESFREYLVKEKAGQVNDAAERIIDFCAGWKELEGSWEQRYALEFYAKHLSESKKTERQEQLIRLLYDQDYITTQQKVLRGFDASNELYRLSLLKSSELDRFDDMLESALSLVDLKYEEANDAPKIVEMVANGEIELALKRIESFGGADKEGMKRKFILYMLCLMELTLLDSKDKPFRKLAIERILNHFDEQIPADTSLINWDDFFPSELVLILSVELAKQNLDYLIIFKKSNRWNCNWINNGYSFNEVQLNILYEASILNSNNFAFISSCLSKQSSIYFENGLLDKADLLFDQAKDFLNQIQGIIVKEMTLVDIAIEACKQKKLEEALRLAENISNVVYKEMTFKEIAFQFALQGDIDGALKITNEIKKSIFGEFSISISKIATILFNCGEFTTCETLMKEAIETIDTDKLFIGTLGHPFGEISIEFAKQKKYDKAIELIEKIPLDKDKIYPLYHISIELEKSGDNELSSDLLDKALEIGLCNIDDSTIYKILPVILKSLEYNKIDHIFFKLKDIYNEKLNAFLFTSIALGCLKLNLNIAARNIYLKSLYLKPKSLETDSISNYKLDLMLHYLKINQHKKSFVIFNEIKDNEIKKKALQSISDYFEKNIRLDNQNYLESIFENYELKILLNLSIIKKLFQFGQLEESYILMQNTLHFIRSITNDENKIKYLIKIANECNDQGRSESMQTILDEAIGLTKNLENINSKIASYFEISVYLLKLNSESWMDFFLEGMTEGDKCNDVVTRLSVLWAAIKLLASNNETQLALKLVDEYSKVSMPPLLLLNQITSEIVRDNLENEAIQIVNAYSKESKDVFIEDLKIPGAINYLKVNNWALVVHTSNSIIDNLKRSNCWESIGNHIKRTDNTLASINKSKDLSNDFSKLYFLRGWSFDIDPTKIDESNLIKVLPFLVKDTEAIENVLQSYALYSLFVAKTPVVQQSRLNRTLNIQWALDIVAQFPKDENIDRLSTNLDEWLHEISDEDDREEIELLTKKVAKGKMTEEEFGDRVRGMG